MHAFGVLCHTHGLMEQPRKKAKAVSRQHLMAQLLVRVCCCCCCCCAAAGVVSVVIVCCCCLQVVVLS